MDEIRPLPALKEFRKRHDPPLSQAELGGKLKVSRETIARWESGRRRIDPDKVPFVAEVTGIPPGSLRSDLAAMLQPDAAAEVTP